MSKARQPATADIESVLGGIRVIPVLTVENADLAVDVARALRDGGLPVVEVTLRTPAALPAIKAIRDSLDSIRVGAGTVLDEGLLAQAVSAGADFVVTPGTPAALISALAAAAVPVIPGAQTLGEMMALRAAGFRLLKFFPAEAAGGRAVLRAVASVLPDLRFCPTGGIGLDTALAYLALPNVSCVGGSWMAPADRVAARAFGAITEGARQAAAL
jgi:2-dehydro-3-deoxyphosphogluconate aldolase/(4S)-4-hydroxy-2-oxoglutarate aldolase